ncbi:MAG: DEAD/DEAH box helicase family protein [Acidobacteriota bacterium]
MVDFNKKLAKHVNENPIDPLVIYEKLDRASDKGPLRPAQITVLNEWHDHLRVKKDVILKMHTGQGKTLVGLLMLQSKLNELGEPVVYLCPNKFLVEQTINQAKQFGVKCVSAEDDLPVEFTNGQAILVTHVQKLFNGKTKFRLRAQSQKVSTILMDDAHSCVEGIKNALTIKLHKDHKAYPRILALFDRELSEQGLGTHAEIKRNKPDSLLAIPYWAWSDKKAEVISIFSEYADDDPIKFAWPLLKDTFDQCLCVITGTELEIFPYHSLLQLFGTYSRAHHRIFMSATVTNDAFLVKGLGISEDAIREPLVDKNEKWSGEKMILIPSLMNSSLTDSGIVQIFGKPRSKTNFGIVVLTPSFRDCERWQNAGAERADTNNIQSIIGQLKAGKCEKAVVIANRYDGIDLPDNACRILVLDSAPSAQSLVERYIEGRREGSDITEMTTARIIEQGMGRAVRGDKDYCVIVLLGPGLVKKVQSKTSQKFLSPQTRKQIEIGLEVTEMVRDEAESGNPVEALRKIINQCLRRDKGWKEYYEQEMNNLPNAIDSSSVLKIFSAEAMAEKKYSEGNYDEAAKVIQNMLDSQALPEHEKGWYLQEMARYIYPNSKDRSNKFQVVAHQKNHLLFKPREGMAFSKVTNVGQKRAEKIIRWIETFESFDQLSIVMDELLNRLTFGVDSDIFERAFNDLAKALGFEGQRPDKEMKEGPDNLWAMQENQYLLAECKNEVLSSRSSIYKDETGQMNNSIAWFRKHYREAVVKLIMVHPAKRLGSGAGFNESVEIMGDRELKRLKQNVRSFFNELKGLDLKDLSESKIQTFLQLHKLTVEDLMTIYSVTTQV